MSKVVGFVEKLNVKSGVSPKNNRPYTLYSMKLIDKTGTELPGWYQCGFNKPACNEGDYVQLEAAPNPKNAANSDVVLNSIKVAKNPPAKPQSTYSGGKGGGTGGAAKVKTSALFGEIGGYNTEDDIRRMSYSASRDAALKTVELLLEQGALKLVKADTKAGAASRFDLIMDSIDKLTVQYFFDAATGRKLETVSDTGIVDTSGDGPLPDADEDEFEDADDGDEFADVEEEADDREFE